MLSKKIGISTITLARSAKESQLILSSLRTLSNIGLPIVVVDGGSPADFIDQLKHIQGVTVNSFHEGGLFSQVRESLKEAANKSNFIFYTESNKLDFFRNQLPTFFKQAEKLIETDENTGLAVASRNPKSFETFPPFQRQTEQTTNQLLSVLLQETGTLDYSYGPRIINGDLIPYLDKVSKDLGWGWMSYLLLMAHQLSQKINTVTLDLPCPTAEKMETKKHQLFRLQQLNQHIVAMEEALKTEWL